MRFTNALMLGLAARGGLAQSPSVVVPVPSSAAVAPSSQAQVPTSAAQPVATSQAPVVPTSAAVPSSVAVPTSAVAVPSSAVLVSSNAGQQTSAAGSQSVSRSASASASVSQSAVVSVISSVVGVTSVVSGSTIVGSTLVQVTTTARASGTATSTASSSASSIASALPVPVKDSVLTQNSELTKVDGQDAVLMNAPAYGQASCYVNAEKPNDIPQTEKVRILATLVITQPQSKRSWWKRQSTVAGCDLSLTVDGSQAYQTSLNKDSTTSNGGKLELSSDAVQAGSQQPKLEFSQTCRQEPVQVTVYQLTITGEKSNVQTPINTNQVNNNTDSGNNSNNNNSNDKGAASGFAASGLTALSVAALVAFFL